MAFYLTKEERNQLYSAKFPDNPGLDVQRDIDEEMAKETIMKLE